MELLQLKYFQIVAQCENITKAANELHISQPSLSQTISRLEQELGVSLFDRRGRTIRLNAFGKAFLNHVNNLFLELEKGKQQVLEMANLQRKQLSIAVTKPHILPYLFGEYIKIHPDVVIKQSQAAVQNLAQQLESGEIDLCIATTPIYGTNIEWRALLDEEILLSVSTKHPFSKRNSINLIDVKDETFISVDSKIDFRSIMEDLCQQAGFKPYIGFEIEEYGIVLKLVEMDLGVALTPNLSLLGYESPNIKHIPINKPLCQRTIGIAWNKKNKLSAVAQDFIDYTITFFKNMEGQSKLKL